MTDDIPRADEPAPLPQDPAVVADLQADANSEPRPPAKIPPVSPPGTTREGFWQRSATTGAIVTTVGLLLLLGRPHLITLLGEAGAVGFEAAVWAWVGAFGIHRIGPTSLREK